MATATATPASTPAVKKPTFVVKMKAYFGVRKDPATGKDHQIGNFMEELKSLSYEEKMAYYKMLSAAGQDCEPPMSPQEVAAAAKK